MYYDEGVYFPQGNPAPIGTPEQILEAGRKMYNELSPETAEFMNFMCDNELFDVIGRKTKTTGGYMTYIPDYKAPFIFANFKRSRDILSVRIRSANMRISRWRQPRRIPCRWNSSRSRG